MIERGRDAAEDRAEALQRGDDTEELAAAVQALVDHREDDRVGEPGDAERDSHRHGDASQDRHAADVADSGRDLRPERLARSEVSIRPAAPSSSPTAAITSIDEVTHAIAKPPNAA